MTLQRFPGSLRCANSEITRADTCWSLKATLVPPRKEGRKRGREAGRDGGEEETEKEGGVWRVVN